MGYAAEKEDAERRVKKVKRTVCIVLVVLLAGLCIFAAFVPPPSWKYAFRLPELEKRAEGELRVHFIDVGQGDATVIELPDGKIMLVDGGNGTGEATNSLMRYLNALKVKKIDYLLATHADTDHCGGLDTVVSYKEVERAFLPFTAPTADSEYASFYMALKEAGCSYTYSSRRIDLSVTDGETPYTLAFVYPYAFDAESSDDLNGADATGGNETSAMVWLDYKGASVLLTGDAPKEVEELLIMEAELGLQGKFAYDLKSTEILKVSHHGSSDATSLEFLEHLGVKDAVISCGENNPYSHPHKETLDALTLAGVKTKRTDQDGSVIVTVHADGKYEVTALGKE